jgi:hypothetical protein
MWTVLISVSRVLAVTGLVLLPVQARAQDAETIADVRCAIVGINFAGMPDASHQTAGTMLSLYYIGRLNGRAPKLNVEDLLIKEIKAMTPADYESEARRCGASLSEKGQEIARIGKDISGREQKPSTPPK